MPDSPYSATLTTLLDRTPEPSGGVITEWVDYDVDGTACRGFLARPASPQERPRPAVLVLADWLGIHPYVQVRCEMLARLGYVAFAGDVYGADVHATPETAAGLAGSYYQDRTTWRARLVAAHTTLTSQPGTDPGLTAAIGYCFGGSGALELARTGTQVAGIVSFHGGLVPALPGDTARVGAKLLVLTGASDPIVPDEAVTAFMDDLRGTSGVDWQVTVYANAMHAFTLPEANDPDHGAMFDDAAERRSWVAMVGFLDELFAAA